MNAKQRPGLWERCAGARDAAACAKGLRQGVVLVSKALLVHLGLLASDPGFPELWSQILSVLQVRLRAGLGRTGLLCSDQGQVAGLSCSCHQGGCCCSSGQPSASSRCAERVRRPGRAGRQPGVPKLPSWSV